MKPWTKRPIEEANLLNPAFCCVLLTSSTVGYKSIDDAGIPYSLFYMTLPIVLHKSTRELLPRSKMTSLAAWITKNAEARIHFAERVITLKPYTREAVLFGLTHGWLSLSDNGKFQTAINKRDVDGFIRKLEGEAKECTKKAFLVGQWLASAGSAQTVMSLWGIRP